jgi:hypothetical protein
VNAQAEPNIPKQSTRPAWLDELNRLLDESADEELDTAVFCRTPLRHEPILFNEDVIIKTSTAIEIAERG